LSYADWDNGIKAPLMVSLLHAAFVAAISRILKARFSGTDNNDAPSDRANPLTRIKTTAQAAMKQTGTVNTSL